MDERDGENQRDSLLDTAAFGSVFKAHYERIWGFLHQRGGRACADELAGEVFATALANRSRFDPERGELHAWLYGIAANLAREWLRRQARGRSAVDRLASSRAASELVTGEAVERVDDRLSGAADAARVVAAMQRLPDRDHEILVLAAWQRLSYEEMAEVLGVPVGTVRSRLSRARARLRELVDLGGQVPAETPTRLSTREPR